MASKMINTTLINNWNDNKSSFDVDLSKIDTYGVPRNYDYNHYLFLRRELEVTADGWAEAKKRGLIRHCKIYRGKFLDYVVHKEFNTIEDWVADAGGKMEDVLYGENRVKNRWVWDYDFTTRQSIRKPYAPAYVELTTLLAALGYVAPPTVDTVSAVREHEEKCRKLTDMLEIEMGMRGLSIERVYVLDDGNQLTSWKTFMGH